MQSKSLDRQRAVSAKLQPQEQGFHRLFTTVNICTHRVVGQQYILRKDTVSTFFNEATAKWVG